MGDDAVILEGARGAGPGTPPGEFAVSCPVLDGARCRPRDEPHGRAGETTSPNGQGAQARQDKP